MFCAGSKLTNIRKGEEKHTTKKLSSFITSLLINFIGGVSSCRRLEFSKIRDIKGYFVENDLTESF